MSATETVQETISGEVSKLLRERLGLRPAILRDSSGTDYYVYSLPTDVGLGDPVFFELSKMGNEKRSRKAKNVRKVQA